ncbi:transposase [Vulgatibacter sp.]|uniref:transposase n=1 Tax=Vulgatibacter sp. TaxID=1971226 RepID=UPI0035619808
MARMLGAKRRRSRKKGQQDLPLKKRFTHGGEREGAGRKRVAPRPQVKHRRRPVLGEDHPVLVTWRVLDHVWSMQSKRSFRVLLRAFRPAVARFGARITHFSVQGNHLHLIVEANGTQALSSAMQGLGVRIARGLNRLMGRAGKVFADRFHAHALGSPTEARNAIDYVLGNTRIHAERQGRTVARYVDRFAVSHEQLGDETAWWRTFDDGSPPVTAPASWLLEKGWRRARPKKTAPAFAFPA